MHASIGQEDVDIQLCYADISPRHSVLRTERLRGDSKAAWTAEKIATTKPEREVEEGRPLVDRIEARVRARDLATQRASRARVEALREADN